MTTTSLDRDRQDPEEWRRTVYEIARAVAPGWERQRARIEAAVAPVREWMISELASGQGDTVLELAAGVGDTGFEAAAAAGKRGSLISTDFSPQMVEVARRRGAELGLRGVDYRVMDAERIELDDDSVDGVLCRFGYMLMADPAAALAETRRVLRPGGHLTLAVWGAPERNPWLTVLAQALVELGHVPPPDPSDPGPFSMASPEGTSALLGDAGFATVRTQELPVSFGFRDAADYVTYAADTAGPLAIVLQGLSTDQRRSLATHLEAPFEAFAGGPGFQLPGLALVAVAS